MGSKSESVLGGTFRHKGYYIDHYFLYNLDRKMRYYLAGMITDSLDNHMKDPLENRLNEITFTINRYLRRRRNNVRTR